MSTFRPSRSRQTPSNRYQKRHSICKWNRFGDVLPSWPITSQLKHSRVQNEEVKTWSQVGIQKWKQSHEHWDVQSDVFSVEIMIWVYDIVVVISENVQKGKQTTVNPSTSLNHQIFMRFHRISISHRVRNILECIFRICLAVNSQTENTIFSQIHICLHVVSFFKRRVQDHFKITSLKQVWLIPVGFDQGFVSIGWPGSRQHM